MLSPMNLLTSVERRRLTLQAHCLSSHAVDRYHRSTHFTTLTVTGDHEGKACCSPPVGLPLLMLALTACAPSIYFRPSTRMIWYPKRVFTGE